MTQIDWLVNVASYAHVVDFSYPIDAAEALLACSTTVLSRAQQPNAECRLCLSNAPGVIPSPALDSVFNLFTQHGWEVAIRATPSYEDGYIVVDKSHALLFGKDHKITFVASWFDLKALTAHFETTWAQETETLYEDLTQPSRPGLILPFQAEQHYWDNLIRRLALKPLDLTNIDPTEFERLVAELLRRDGYDDITLTSQSRDGGFDLFAVTNTSIGRHMYLVECKRYKRENPVGVALVRSLYGVMEAQRATAALLVTTSYFTKGAVTFREQDPHRLALTDYEQLVQWLRRLSR